jgi:ABC-type transport system substrate-binding protein
MKNELKGFNFADELHKINDMLVCSKEDFLYSYGYLDENDYEETRKFIIELMKNYYKQNNIKADIETYEENEDEDV